VDEIEMGRVLAHVYGGDSGDRVDGRLLAVMVISTASLFHESRRLDMFF